MATYYVDPVNGSDSNNGLGPDASHASNKPFQTIAKLIATSGAMSSGDTAYLAPGVYRENVTVGITSPVAETKIIGDPQNAQGFKTSGGVLVEAAPVIWTAYTTNDTTAPSTQCVSLNGRSHLTFSLIAFIGGSSNALRSTVSTSTYTTIRNCYLICIQGSPIQISGAAGVQLNVVIDSCVLYSHGNIGLYINPTANATMVDHSSVVSNTIICTFANTGVSLGNSVAGFAFRNCVLNGGNYGVRSENTVTGGSVSNTIRNCIVTGATFSVSCATSETPNVVVTETYNILRGARSNVDVGSNSKSSNEIPPLFHLGWEQIFGFAPRFPFSPYLKSTILGFGSDSDQEPTTDILGRPKPSGSGVSGNANALKCVGPCEGHDFGQRETSVKDASDASVKLVGPGDHDLKVAVNASPMTISLKVRYDTNHGTTNKPQAILVANPALGVSAETLTASVGVDTWEALTFTQFTPNAKGVVTIRLNSRAAAGSGLCYFDTLSIS